jgi:site-specific DNA recombinase
MTAESVALYARVSSDRQAAAGTIASQLAALRERIAADGATLAPAHEFVDDGYSGSTLTRPALERLRDRVALGGLTRLYVLAPDRLARRYAHQVLLLEEFARAGVQVCFLYHPPGQTPDEVLLTQIQGILAEYERAAIEERTRRGRRFAAQQGQVSVLSGAPYGYRYQRPLPGGPATYTVVPSEAPVIEQIFTWVGLERCSLTEVARRLNAAAVPSRSGKPWSRTSLGGILSNPAYRGQAAFGKTRSLAGPPEGRPCRSRTPTSRRTWRTRAVPPAEWVTIPVPALVTADLWEMVQEQLRENAARARQGQREARNLLPGLVVCGRCGYACSGKWITRPADGSAAVGYYRCAGRDRERWVDGQPCPTPAVRIEVLDTAVWEVVRGILRDPARLWTEYTTRTAGAAPAPGPDYEQQRRQLQRSLDRLLDSYTDGLLTKEELRPRLEGLRARLARVTEQAQQAAAEQAAAQQVAALQEQWERFAVAVGEQLAEAPAPVQRALIRALVKRVEVDPEQVRVVVRIGPGPPSDRYLQYCLNLPHSAFGGPMAYDFTLMRFPRATQSGLEMPDQGPQVIQRGQIRQIFAGIGGIRPAGTGGSYVAELPQGPHVDIHIDPREPPEFITVEFDRYESQADYTAVRALVDQICDGLRLTITDDPDAGGPPEAAQPSGEGFMDRVRRLFGG